MCPWSPLPMRRRDILGAFAALGAGTRLNATTTQTPLPTAPAAAPLPTVRRDFRLRPVTVAPERVIRTIVGLRPFRPSGFVVRAEKAGDKTIVHNYGHGGAGLTLSWGTAHLAALEVQKTGEHEIAVLGVGAVGLATAHILLERGFKVSVYTKDLP